MVELPPDEWQARHHDLVAADRWIIDGNYSGSMAARLTRATLVVWLDLPTSTCLGGAVRRIWRYRRGGRPDMADGCRERFDAEFAKFLLYIATFRRTRRPAIEQRLRASALPTVQLRTVGQRAAFLHRVYAGEPASPMASPG